MQTDTPFQGNSISGYYLHGTGAELAGAARPDQPARPGPDRCVSPALGDLLNSDAGESLRARFPQQIVGTISEPGLRGPNDLVFYAGTTSLPTTAQSSMGAMDVYKFGAAATSAQPSTRACSCWPSSARSHCSSRSSSS